MTAPTGLTRDGRRSASHGAGDPGPGSGPLGPALAAARVHRAGLLGWTSFFAVAACALVWLYSVGQRAKELDTAFCIMSGHEPGVPECPDGDGFSAPYAYSWMLELAQTSITFLPFAVAVYVGGALVARDFERGTAGLAWTQSVTPARWLATKLAVPGLLTGAGTTVLILLQRWVWTSGAQGPVRFWWEQQAFHAGGPVGLAFTALGLATGALAAVLTRRTLPAAGISVAALAAVYSALGSFWHLLWPKVRLTGTDASGLSDRAGEKFDVGMITDSGTRAGSFCDGRAVQASLDKCLAKYDGRDVFAVAHPESHFWPLQFAEAGIVLALAAVVTVVAFRLLPASGPAKSATGGGTPTVSGTEAVTVPHMETSR